MARLQLALDVADLDAAVAFYTDLFATAPHKRRDGYANFRIADPPLKLVLFEKPEAAGGIDHLGIEVDSTEAVRGHTARLAAVGLPTRVEDDVTCCHATQDKVWLTGPDATPWEIYTITDDAPEATATAGATAAAAPQAQAGVDCTCR